MNRSSLRSQTFYFHGQPGSAAELALFAGIRTPDWIVPDRANLSITGQFDALADQIRCVATASPVRLVGFSLGTFVALEIAARLHDYDIEIDLVSAAAPLQLGNFLNDMAGKQVFSLAGRSPLAFQLGAFVQSAAARAFTQQLMGMLFASAQGEDRALAKDAHFRVTMCALLRESYGRGREAYCTEIGRYVADWSVLLPSVKHPVTLWHGVEDNWAPIGMADALANRLPNVTKLHRIEGLSHYSTLRRMLSVCSLF
jgi:pimeloyl-ACP methyl ester carboxylesterase